jgi:DHA1 family tetracycline resistance protein-like MFS transporter
VPPALSTARAPRRAALAFIFVTVALDMLALGVIVPILPKLVIDFVGQDAARAARVYGVFGTAWALAQLVAAPLLGALSDRFGRRPVILLSNVGLGLDYVLMALAPSLSWLFVGRVISGITAASVPTASAYIADVTPPERRAAAFGLLGAAFGFGFVVGPAVGGLLGGIDPRLPFWVAAALSLINALYGLLVLPESLPPERRARFGWHGANPVSALALLRSHPELSGLAVVTFLYMLAHEALPSTFVLYAHHRYGWDQRAVGLTLAVVGVCSALVQALVVGRAVARLGERRALAVGLLAGSAGFAIQGLAPTGAWFLLGVPVMALWGLARPAMQAIMTRRIEPEEQGRLQGAQSSVTSMAGLIGPGLFTQTFAVFAAQGRAPALSGAPFVLAAALVVAATAVAWHATRERAPDDRAGATC